MMTTETQQSGITLGVLGAGSFGTALAIHLARNGHRVLLWGRDDKQMKAMAQAGQNARYLPDQEFPDGLEPVSDLQQTLEAADDLISAVPSHGLADMLKALKPMLKPGQRIANSAKGLEPGSGKLLHEVYQEVMGQDRPFTVLSGPTFAKEIGMAMPTALTIASTDEKTAQDYAAYFHGKGFRAYTSTDVVGVELGGAAKNVLAIAVGCSDGLGLGANTRTLMICRGLAEIMRLGEALGGKRETFMGLAGMGDLVLTCTDDQSRNRRFGLALSKGLTTEQACEEIGQVVEGVRAAAEVHRLAQRHNIDMPILGQVYAVLHEGKAPLDALKYLTERPSKKETA